MSFINTLAWWQWSLLGLVPIGVVLLYFLKLKRRPLEVPSTYLWSRTLEDLHVNSIWQRLRRNLLLLLQLLMLAMIFLALTRPGWRDNALVGERFIFLLDTSASMQATDEGPSRLEAAKQQIESLIDGMKPGQTGMVLTSSNQSHVEQPYTDNRRLLKNRVRDVQASNRSSDLDEALRYAAGLANPGRSAASAQDVQVAEPMPATIYLFSDGGFATVPSFFLGNLEPKYYPIGQPEPDNVAILAFSAERNVENPLQTQAYGRVENLGAQPADVELSLLFNGRLMDATRVVIEPGATQGVDFELHDIGEGVLELRLDRADDLAVDNVAYACVNMPRRARVLLVTPGNDSLQLCLTTQEAQRVVELRVAEPGFLASEEYQRQAQTGGYDLVIYDRCVPEAQPLANTLFIGRVPKLEGWSAGPLQGPPIIVDTERIHPLMQLVEMGDVRIVEGFAVTFPAGGTALIDADIGALMAIAPRDSFEDVVVGFEIVTVNEGRTEINTNWPIRRAYPVFFMNLVRYLGGGRTTLALPWVPPGKSVSLNTSTPVDRLFVTAPNREVLEILRESTGEFMFTRTELLGPYEVREQRDGAVTQRFAVNLFNRRESQIKPAEKIELEHESIPAEASLEQSRGEGWRWLLLLALLVLCVEWYVYNRRVYV